MHPDGYHKSEPARARCWGCSHPELLEWTEAELVEAQRLHAEGWIPTSNRYHGVSRVDLPPFQRAVRLSHALPAWAARALRDAYSELQSEAGARSRGEHQTIAPGVYRALKSIRRTHSEDGAAR